MSKSPCNSLKIGFFNRFIAHSLFAAVLSATYMTGLIPVSEASKIDSNIYPKQNPMVMLEHSEFYDLQVAIQYIEKKAYSKALPLLKRAREKAPTNILVLYHLGTSYLEMAKTASSLETKEAYLASAKEVFNRVESINPDLDWVYYKLGKIALMENKPAKAEEIYKAGLKIDPNNAGLYFNLAGLYDQNDDTDQAIFYYQQAILKDPDFVFAYNNIGLLLEKKHQWDEAERAYQLVLKYDPQYHFAKINLGNLYAEKGKVDEAQALYLEVLTQNPDDSWAHLYLGNVYLKKGMTEKAALSYKRSTETNPSYAPAYYLLAMSLEKANRYEEALGAAETYLKLSPNGAFRKEVTALLGTLKEQRSAQLNLLPSGSLSKFSNSSP
ncbi:MAG: tetratricopeptide repeat protein [Cyanobacteria bacterium]|nr:tetratricopeptide repeat protein [Cyanobacteriota bacterium]